MKLLDPFPAIPNTPAGNEADKFQENVILLAVDVFQLTLASGELAAER